MPQEYFDNLGNKGQMQVDPASIVLSDFEGYKNHVPAEFRNIVDMIVAPGSMLGVGNGEDVAEIINDIDLLEVYYDVLPESMKGVNQYVFAVMRDNLKTIVNAKRYGRLLRALTGHDFEPDVPPWIAGMLLRETPAGYNTSTASPQEGGEQE